MKRMLRMMRSTRTSVYSLAFSLLIAAGAGTTSAGESAATGADPLGSTVARMGRIGACYSPSFSPDATRLAIICTLSGSPQVWIVPVDGGWPTQVTAYDDPVGAVRWSPEGDWLAISVAPGGGMNQQIDLVRPDGLERRRLTDDGKDNNWLGGWTHDARFVTLSSNRGNRVL